MIDSVSFSYSFCPQPRKASVFMWREIQSSRAAVGVAHLRSHQQALGSTLQWTLMNGPDPEDRSHDVNTSLCDILFTVLSCYIKKTCLELVSDIAWVHVMFSVQSSLMTKRVCVCVFKWFSVWISKGRVLFVPASSL